MTQAEMMRIKAAVRTRDGFRCAGCGMTNDQHIERFGRQLDVHRVTPGSEYSVDGCAALCRVCHGSKPRAERASVPGRTGKPIQVYLDDDLRERLGALAAAGRRALSAEVRIALEKHIADGGRTPEPQQPSLFGR